MKTGHYHLTGVAGVGMSAIAQALAAVGCAVVTMGARDPDLPKLARSILERVGSSR
jgi:UDP-N-acetylmuramate-alanine ligase